MQLQQVDISDIPFLQMLSVPSTSGHATSESSFNVCNSQQKFNISPNSFDFVIMPRIALQPK